jgi:hypothetical protein
MSFFKKRGVAVLLTIIIVLCATLISINVKLQAKCDNISDIFYNGVKISGTEYPAMSTPINELCTIGDEIVLMADNYRIDTTTLSENLRYLKLGLLYSSQNINYIGSCYSDYIQALKTTVNELNNTGLSERHSTALAEYETQIEADTATVTQGAKGYNESVRSFLKSYDKYPTYVWAALTGTEFPGYFGNY